MNTTRFTAAAQKFAEARPSRPTIEAYEQTLTDMQRITPPVREALDNARRIRNTHDIVFYIAGALTGMTESVKQRYATLADTVNADAGSEVALFGYAPHVHGTDPVKHPNVTPEEVRDIDYLWAAIVPDAHINFWGPMAHGNAIEEGWAEVHGVPSLYVVPEDMTTSRLVRGMYNILDTIVYTDFENDGLPQVQAFLEEVRQLPNPTER